MKIIDVIKKLDLPNESDISVLGDKTLGELLSLKVKSISFDENGRVDITPVAVERCSISRAQVGKRETTINENKANPAASSSPLGSFDARLKDRQPVIVRSDSLPIWQCAGKLIYIFRRGDDEDASHAIGRPGLIEVYKSKISSADSFCIRYFFNMEKDDLEFTCHYFATGYGDLQMAKGNVAVFRTYASSSIYVFEMESETYLAQCELCGRWHDEGGFAFAEDSNEEKLVCQLCLDKAKRQ